jgi:hypothetical protein
MNKHFSEILKIMDAAKDVPESITLHTNKSITLSTNIHFAEDFKRDIERYCLNNNLSCKLIFVPGMIKEGCTEYIKIIRQ